jgi:hypothetical protein
MSNTEKKIAFDWLGLASNIKWVDGVSITLWIVVFWLIAFSVTLAISLMGQESKMRSLKRFVHRHSFQGF